MLEDKKIPVTLTRGKKNTARLETDKCDTGAQNLSFSAFY